MLGVSQSRGLKLFGREIIFQEFQPMCCWYLNVRRTDGRTDRRTTYCRITALCASIAVKRVWLSCLSSEPHTVKQDTLNVIYTHYQCIPATASNKSTVIRNIARQRATKIQWTVQEIPRKWHDTKTNRMRSNNRRMAHLQTTYFQTYGILQKYSCKWLLKSFDLNTQPRHCNANTLTLGYRLFVQFI